MFHRITPFIAIAGIVLVLVACQSAPPPVVPPTPTAEALSREQTLVLGEVSSDPATKFEEIELMNAYLAAHLAGAGITKIENVVTTDLDVMVDYLKTGQVDLFFDNPQVALVAYEEAGAHPLLRRSRKGVSEYHTNIFVKQDSGITDPQALLGQSVALEFLGSSTGDLVPRAHLLSLGYKLSAKNNADSPVAADEIGYVFAGSHDNIVAWVLEGKVAGGAIASDDFDGLEDDVKSQLVIVAETPEMPRHVVMARPGLDATLEARIVEVLMNMHQTSEGQAALKKFGKTDQFDQLPLGPEGTMQLMQAMLKPVQ